MAFLKPVVNQIKTDIKEVSIYIRTTKKFGKTTLFRDVIIEKYGDPTYGLLVQCGKERGANMLDNINTLPSPLQTYKDAKELKDWLINEKGKEHNIQIIAFDTVDELVPIFEKETIRQSKIESPDKPCKTINAAFGGYHAGQRYTANELIKPYIDELREAGFGVWAISHTKFKTIKEKGGTDENGYQQLTSNLESAYESAFGDIFDMCLTGTIDRETEERDVKQGDKTVKKRYVSGGSIRKLYFRETPLIDAGGRFALGAVPEYMVFDKGNMAADFIKVIEDGLEKSKTIGNENIVKPVEVPQVSVEVEQEEVFDDEQAIDVDALKNEIREKFKNAAKSQRQRVTELRNGVRLDNIYDVELLNEILDVLSE